MSTVRLQGTEEQMTVGKVVCVGRNYAEHAKEMKADVPTEPVIFLKPPSAIVANGGAIVIPTISNDVHHEVELTVLIGKGGKAIGTDEALRHVAGYGVGLDMTLRDVQAEAKKRGLPWTLAKGFDTSAPLSEFVPAVKVVDPRTLEISLLANGQLRQRATAREMIFGVAELIAFISRWITLERGDILFTGTPEGVARVRSGDRLQAFLRDESGSALASLSVRVQ